MNGDAVSFFRRVIGRRIPVSTNPHERHNNAVFIIAVAPSRRRSNSYPIEVLSAPAILPTFLPTRWFRRAASRISASGIRRSRPTCHPGDCGSKCILVDRLWSARRIVLYQYFVQPAAVRGTCSVSSSPNNTPRCRHWNPYGVVGAQRVSLWQTTRVCTRSGTQCEVLLVRKQRPVLPTRRVSEGEVRSRGRFCFQKENPVLIIPLGVAPIGFSLYGEFGWPRALLVCNGTEPENVLTRRQ